MTEYVKQESKVQRVRNCFLFKKKKEDDTMFSDYGSAMNTLFHGVLMFAACAGCYLLFHLAGLNSTQDTIHFLPFWENGVKFFTIEGPNKEKVEFSQYL